MGITIVQKSDLSKKKTESKVALVLAGGAVSGGAFKAGGLKALNDFLMNRKVTDFDIYIGVSAGGFLAVPLSGGIPPEEILKSLDGTSQRFDQLTPFDLYNPNLKELIYRPLLYLSRSTLYFPQLLIDLIRAFPTLPLKLKSAVIQFLKSPKYSNYESLFRPIIRALESLRDFPSLASAFPSGIFDNRSIEQYIRRNSRQNRMPNHFKALKKLRGKELYISAMALDTAERVVFGWDERNDVSISEAVMASTALPGFYKPSRIKGIDYVDGGVQLTADIDLAIEKGAELVICYNPFRPFKNSVKVEYLEDENRYVTEDRRIADSGIFGIFNQAFRTLYHSRLAYSIQKYRSDRNFKGDIIVIEPKEDDFTFFDLNPVAFWNRAKAAKLGFESVKSSVQQRFEELSPILSSYGIEINRSIPQREERRLQAAAGEEDKIMSLLESKNLAQELRVISGGR